MTPYSYLLVVCLVVSTTTGLPKLSVKYRDDDVDYSPPEGDFTSNTLDEVQFSSVVQPDSTVEVILSEDTEALPQIEESSDLDLEDEYQVFRLQKEDFPKRAPLKKPFTVEESMKRLEEYKATFKPLHDKIRRIKERNEQKRRKQEEKERKHQETEERKREEEERMEQERKERERGGFVIYVDHSYKETEEGLVHQDIDDGQTIDAMSITPQETILVDVVAADREVGETRESESVEDTEEMMNIEFVPKSVEDIVEAEARYSHQVISVREPEDTLTDVVAEVIPEDSEVISERSDSLIEETKFSGSHVDALVDDAVETEQLPYFESVEDIESSFSQSDAEEDDAIIPSFVESQIDDALSSDDEVLYHSKIDVEAYPSGLEESQDQTGEAADRFSLSEGKSIDDKEDEKTNLAIRLPKHSRVLISPDESEFDCSGRKIGMYADRRLGCRVVHVCHPFTSYFGFMSRKVFSFVCDDGTVFDQRTQTCSKIDIALPCINSTGFFEFQNKVDGIFIKLLQPLKSILSLKSKLTPTPVEKVTDSPTDGRTTPKPQMFTMVPIEDAEEKGDEVPSSGFEGYTPLRTTSALIRKTKVEIENKIARLAETLSSLKNEIKKDEEVVTEAIPITIITEEEKVPDYFTEVDG